MGSCSSPCSAKMLAAFGRLLRTESAHLRFSRSSSRLEYNRKQWSEEARITSVLNHTSWIRATKRAAIGHRVGILVNGALARQVQRIGCTATAWVRAAAKDRVAQWLGFQRRWIPLATLRITKVRGLEGAGCLHLPILLEMASVSKRAASATEMTPLKMRTKGRTISTSATSVDNRIQVSSTIASRTGNAQNSTFLQ